VAAHAARGLLSTVMCVPVGHGDVAAFLGEHAATAAPIPLDLPITAAVRPSSSRSIPAFLPWRWQVAMSLAEGPRRIAGRGREVLQATPYAPSLPPGVRDGGTMRPQEASEHPCSGLPRLVGGNAAHASEVMDALHTLPPGRCIGRSCSMCTGVGLPAAGPRRSS
jgi:hypothetical protein